MAWRGTFEDGSASVNLTPATAAAAAYALMRAMKAAGWTVPSSSDGTTYNASGDQITSAGSGAGGWANAGAWRRLRAPNGLEVCIQQSSGEVRITVSISGGHVGGSPGATRVPTATDGQLQHGSGTDAAPGYAALLGGADDSYYYHCVAEDVAPYRVWAGSYPKAGGSCNSAFMIECLAYSSRAPADAAPYVFYTDSSNGSGFSGSWTTYQFSNTNNGRPPRSWYKYGLAGAAWTPLCAFYTAYSVGATVRSPEPGGSIADPIDGAYELVPMIYGRAPADGQAGMRGCGSMARWCGLAQNGDVIEEVDGTRWIQMNYCALPWPSSAAPSKSGGSVERSGRDWVVDSATAVPDITDPIITSVLPASATLQPDDLVECDVYDAASALTLVAVWVTISGEADPVPVYLRSAFVGRFAAHGTISGAGTVASPYHLSFKPAGRWPQGATVQLEVDAIDAAGNYVELTA